MLHARLLQPGQLELVDVPIPDPGPGELLVHVEVALTCGTDLKLYERGHPRLPTPSPFGHEMAGVVAGVGAGVHGFREGDAIASVPTAPCGQCRLCRRGRENLCAQAVGRITLGAFSEYLVLPQHLVQIHVFPRPAGLAPEDAAGLEPLACVVHGASRVSLAQADSLVILGDGPIAMLFVQLARLQGVSHILVAGRHARRLEFGEAFGARTTRLEGEALHALVHESLGGADIVIECVGRPELWETAPGLAAPGGEVLLYGGCAAGTRATFDTTRLHYDEIDLKGAFHYTPRDVREALALLANGHVSVARLVTHRMPLARLPEALTLALQRDALKVAVVP
jgi:L-iditol 2-dehydrogenase